MKINKEYIPDGPIWLLFDLANGHAPSKRYVWWFDTKKDAEAHIRHQKTYPNAVELSEPIRFVPDNKDFFKGSSSPPGKDWDEICCTNFSQAY